MSFDQLQPIPCLVLLGEPGIGKSSSLNREADSSVSCPARSATVHLDLRGYGSESRLMSGLFDSNSFKQWESENGDLFLYLDSLDECLLRIDNVASLLADELPKHPLTRLKLRIACRTASWPLLLEGALSKAYGADSFAAYELVPLRRCDVELALATARVQDVERFLKRIEDLNIESFAIKPITLGFLIETFMREDDLPTRALDLYARGCQILCEEQNESRRASGKTGSLAPLERMAIASRIAAATQLGNRYAVWTGTQAAPSPPEDIPIESIAVGSETDSRVIPLTRASVLESLDTGLFSSRGQQRLGWAHQALAEYLAARFCIRHNMPIQQLRTILFHPRRSRIVPQLRDVASWIALQHPDLFQEISQLDPEVLLGSAAPNLTDDQRAVVTDSLLRHCNEGQFLRVRGQIDPLLRNLSYSGLGSQIGPTIRDKKGSEVARHLAIDIARRCNVVELASAIADIALDSDEVLNLRNSAAFTIGEIGDPDTKVRLKPLVVDQEDDANQERKGAALFALWPGLISADELFACLTPRRAPNTYGLYWRFLEFSVLPNLKPGDLPAALRWYSAQQHEFHGPFEDLLHGILELALEHVDEGNNALLLAQALEPRIRTQGMINSGNLATPFETKLAASIEKRHHLLNALLPLLGGCQSFVLFHPLQLVYADDFDWLISRIVNGESPASIHLEVGAVVRFCCSWEAAKLV